VFEIHCLDVLKILSVDAKLGHDGSALLLSVLGTSVDLAGNFEAVGGKFLLEVLTNSGSTVSSLSSVELGEVFSSNCLNNFLFGGTAGCQTFFSSDVHCLLVGSHFLLDSL